MTLKKNLTKNFKPLRALIWFIILASIALTLTLLIIGLFYGIGGTIDALHLINYSDPSALSSPLIMGLAMLLDGLILGSICVIPFLSYFFTNYITRLRLKNLKFSLLEKIFGGLLIPTIFTTLISIYTIVVSIDSLSWCCQDGPPVEPFIGVFMAIFLGIGIPLWLIASFTVNELILKRMGYNK